jgi:hypothetical protein
MDQYERQEKKRAAMRRLRAQRRRAGELRRRVVATALVAFALLWAVVFAQMATGNDPVLAGTTPKRAAVNGGSVRESIETTDPRETSGSAVEPEPIELEAEAVETEPEVEALLDEPAPVTTSQS